MKLPTAGKHMRLIRFALLGLIGASSLQSQELKIDRPPRAKVPADHADWLLPGWEKVGENLVRAEFRVPPDFLVLGSGADAEDPFGGGGGFENRTVQTARQILESVGIPFPEGSSATYSSAKSKVIVTNTRENMDLVQVYLETGCWGLTQQISIRAEIYQLGNLQVLQLLESAAAAADHTPERNAVLALVRDGHAKLVACPSVVTTGGQRVKLEDGSEIRVPGAIVHQPQEPDGSADDRDREPAHVEFDTRVAGTILEAEPSIGADGFTISINIALEHHTADPEFDATIDGEAALRFYAKSIQTNCVLLDGNFIILGTWKPTGNAEYAAEDVRHIVFLTANMQTLGE